MRRALTSAEIALLAAHPHSCRMYLVVDRPPTLLAAQVNMPISTGQTIVNFSNESPDATTLYRTWGQLDAGDTVEVGTARGKSDVGTVALVSAGPAQIVVQSNSIAWQNLHRLHVGTKWYAIVSALGLDADGNFNGGATIIPYDNATGDYTDVTAGMTLYLGSAPGLRDLGSVRVKAITATQITVAMNSDVQWADNAYITIVEAVDLWSIYPRINPDTGAYYKDEVAYDSNVNRKQTVWLPPVPIMGPPGVAFLDDDEAFLDFIGEDSYTLCSNGIKTSSSGSSLGDVECIIGDGWTWPDGTLVSGSATAFGTEASPNRVKWTTGGRRLVSLNVKNDKPSTDSYRKRTTGYRPVFILNRPGTAEGVDEPYVDFNVETLEGDFESGGWTATIQVFGDADIDEFPDNAMIVLFAEERWGGPNSPIALATSSTSVAIGTGSKTFTIQTGLQRMLVVGNNITITSTQYSYKTMTGTITSYNNSTGVLVVNITDYESSGTYAAWTISPHGPIIASIGGYPGRENVKLVAWIMEETTHIGFAADGRRYVEFQVQTIDGMLKAIAGYIMSVEDRVHAYGTDEDASCIDWWHVFKLQVNRAIQYITAFHTTLHNMCDVYIANDNSRVWAWDFGDGSLYRQIDDYAASAIAARALSTRQSQLYIERDIQTATGDHKPAFNVLALDKDSHLREELELPRPHRGKVRRVDLEGVLWDGYNSQAMIARAPSEAPNQDGIDESISGYIVDGDDFNDAWYEFAEVAGYTLAALNNPWTGLSFKFQGNFSFLDIAPQGYLTLSLLATANKRGIAWTDRQLIPRRITMNYDAKAQALLVDATIDAAAGGSPGVTGGYVTPEQVVYNVPYIPINVPGWNNVIYAGTANGLYKVQMGVKDWYPIIQLGQYPFEEFSYLNVESVVIDPCVQSSGVNTDLLAIISDAEYDPDNLHHNNAGLFRGKLALATNTYTWTPLELGDPPNSWSDDPAPTLANCYLDNIAANWVTSGIYYLTATYYNGSAYHSWLVKVVESGGVVTASWMPLAWDYPSLTQPFTPYDVAVDTEDGTRIYVVGRDYGSPYGYGLFVASNVLALVRSIYDIGQASHVVCPFYRSGGSRDGDHVVLYGYNIKVGASLHNAVYSTDGGATRLALNTGSQQVTDILRCDSVDESSYIAVTHTSGLSPVDPITYHIQRFTAWGTDWSATPKTDIIVEGQYIMELWSVVPRRNSPLFLATYEYEGILNYRFTNMILLFDGGAGLVRLDIPNLIYPGTCIAIDWGR